jgi:hypothetical protein
MKAYFLAATESGDYAGVRNGMTSGMDVFKDKASAANFNSDSNLPWMHAAEAYFLLAEAKLRFGMGSTDAKDLYEDGIRTSFSSAGVSGADNYINDSASLPLTEWVNPSSKQSVSVLDMLTYLAPAWDESASTQDNLNRIMIQKWISLYPDGQEAWSEMRRSGQPGWVRIYTYNYASGVTSNDIIRRIQFPSTEYSNNAANVQAAVTLLGGQDNAGTHLWWDAR